MGHQLARSAAAAAVAAIVLAGGCGGDDGSGDPPPVLDNARELVAAAEPTGSATTSAPAGVAQADELPPPDPSRFEGANRFVNLLTDADGNPIEIDVWGQRTFDTGPILLASELGFGAASGYVSAPVEYTIVAVGAGAGPDGSVLAEAINAVDGERITTIVTADERGDPVAKHVFEGGTESSIEPPSSGTGLLVVDAPNAQAFDDELEATVGSDRFEIGDGSGACRRQRREASGLVPELLGDQQPVEIEASPGSVRLTVHPWVATLAPCSSPAVHDVTVRVEAGATVLVLVVRTPAGTIDSIVLPVGE